MFKTIVVTDESIVGLSSSVEQITFQDYLQEYPKKDEPRTRILNLCDTEQYLSQGYYCSLLAEARNHQILPSVKSINRLRHKEDMSKIACQLQAQFQQDLFSFNGKELYLFFGKTNENQLSKLAAKIFSMFPAPILKIRIDQSDVTCPIKIERVSINAIPDSEFMRLQQELIFFTESIWRSQSSFRKYRWDMAILVNPNEVDPPSNKEALAKFIKAAGKNGIRAVLVTMTQGESFDIANYDALFIRETTAIDHHTYNLAETAEQQGLVVIDDPQSILRCCNKVFLHDAFNYQGVLSPKTKVISQVSTESIAELESEFGFPMVLKMPEGSFSRGVYKVNDPQELTERLNSLFTETALVIAQEYMYTDFDWRIGILNGKPIYACRYMMARNHWQIYNHKANKRNSSGGFESMPTFEVPKSVLDMAVRSAKCVGDGLYGVDVKQKSGKAYVLEVNDNPSIDQGIENAYLGDELYMIIMAEFRRRLESRGL